MTVTVLVRYGELALKSAPVRREFEHRLGRNILEAFAAAAQSCRIRADHGHLYVTAESSAQPIRLLRRIFGITSVSEVTQVATDRSLIRESVLAMAEPRVRPGCRFAIRARRTGTHTFTSQELAAELGTAVLARWPERGLMVDLESPDVELFVEVRGPQTYLYLGRHPGPGGLPLGVAGAVASYVEGPRGALGTYMMMKRGCRCAVLVAPPAQGLVEQTLAHFDPNLQRVLAAEGVEASENQLRSLLSTTHSEGVVLPLTVEQFPNARAYFGETVVFSPTVGLTEDEVIERWHHVEELGA